MQILETPRKKPRALPQDVIEKALKSPKTNKVIAQELGVHKETVVAWRKKYSIPRFTPHAACREIIHTTLTRSADGAYQAELAQHCKCSRQKLYWILRSMVREGTIYASGETNARKWYPVTNAKTM